MNRKSAKNAFVFISIAASLSACRDGVALKSIEVAGPSALQVDAIVLHKSGKTETLQAAQNLTQQNLSVDASDPVKDLELTVSWQSQRNLPAGASRSIQLKTRIELDQEKELPVAAADDTQVTLNGKEFDGKCSSGIALTFKDQTLRVDLQSFASLLKACQFDQKPKFDPTQVGYRNVGEAHGFLATNYFSESQEAGMGADFVADFNSKNAKYILNSSHPTSRYAQDLMNRLVGASDRPDLKPTVFVINADILNAFALPGGYVYVFRGLIDACDSEAELAGVLGHEWAHVTARHGTKNMSNTITTLLVLIGGSIAVHSVADATDAQWDDAVADVLSAAGGVYAQLNLLGLSRANEAEADLLGSQYAMRAGFAPYGISQMFEVFKEKSKDKPSVEELLSTHPSHDNRINDVYNLSAFLYPDQAPYVLTSPAFTVARQEMNSLPRQSVDYSKMLALQFVETWNGMAKKQLKTESIKQSAKK